MTSDDGCGMILKPKMILQPKPGDSDTKTDDSATKHDSETKTGGSETKDDSETKEPWKPKMVRRSDPFLWEHRLGCVI